MTLLEKAQQMKHGATIWAEWLGPNKHPVETETAQGRADICLVCPMNEPGNVITETIALAIRRQMELKKHLNLHLMGEKSLHTCQACSCPLRLKLWEQIGRLLPEPDQWHKYWEKCWMWKEKP